jgi:hypothetical protein
MRDTLRELTTDAFWLHRRPDSIRDSAWKFVLFLLEAGCSRYPNRGSRRMVENDGEEEVLVENAEGRFSTISPARC